METCAYCFQPVPHHHRECRSAYVFKIAEEERSMILLACAVLAVQYPGYDYLLGEIATLFRGRTMFETFKVNKKACAVGYVEG